MQANTKELEPSKRVKDTVTYFRLEKYKTLLHQIADDTFRDDRIPQIELKPLKGRPGRYRTTEQLNNDVKSFFHWCGDNWALPTIKLLSLRLGWYSDLFYNYIKLDGFHEILKRAKDVMAYRLELAAEETGSPGPIFLLKASHGYSDEKEVNVNVTIDVASLYSKALVVTHREHGELENNATKKIQEVELASETDEVSQVIDV